MTVTDMLSFLGLAGYSRQWICDYAIVIAPLRAMVKDAGQTNNRCPLRWTTEGLESFEMIQQRLQTAPALGTHDYKKSFDLFVSTRDGFASAVQTQSTPAGNQPLAYYSSKLDNIKRGLPPCYQGLATAVFAYKKASTLTMGHPSTHQLHAMLTSPAFVLTQSRLTGYHLVLCAPELTIKRCTTVNPSESVPAATDGEPHCCEAVTDGVLKPRPDLHHEPLAGPLADVQLFVDGSCF